MPGTDLVLYIADQRAKRRFRSWLDRTLATGQPDPERWARYLEAENVVSALRGIERDEDAAHDAADWRLSLLVGQYATLPDVPLADPGDHFRYPDTAA